MPPAMNFEGAGDALFCGETLFAGYEAVNTPTFTFDFLGGIRVWSISNDVRVRFASLPSDRLPQNQLPGLKSDLSESETGDFINEVVRRWRSVARRER